VFVEPCGPSQRNSGLPVVQQGGTHGHRRNGDERQFEYAFALEGGEMKLVGFLLLALLFASQATAAQTANGSGALALAALVGNVSANLDAVEKSGLLKLLDGKTDFSFPAGKTITVVAAKVTCRAGNVDIASHSCELSFGSQVISLTGRSAHELYATLAEIGIPPDGAAGSIFEAVSDLRCTIDPNEVKQKAGGGAECHYAPAN
jgi:hypothetical protein